MKNENSKILMSLMCASLLVSPLAIGSGKDAGAHASHDDHAEAESHSDEAADNAHDEGSEVSLSVEQMQAAGIVLKTLKLEALPQTVGVPGEVQFDRYRSAQVAPLIDAIVIDRLAKLGDHIDKGTPLVRLASVEVAQAQGDLEVTAREWQRVKKLGIAAVGGKRYAEAEIAYEQARLKLQAYGVSPLAIKAIADGRRDLPLGQFELTAPLAGTVLQDEFVLGQRVEPGQILFLLTDESSIWVEAHVQPSVAAHIDKGMGARVRMTDGWHQGAVIQRHHLLDERTRTVPVRIQLSLPEAHHHHRGEFVQVEIQTGDGEPALSVPEEALMRVPDGDWVVFVEDEPNTFQQVEIERGESRAGRVVIAGIAPGSRVVTSGAFFLASELAKSGFSIHNH